VIPVRVPVEGVPVWGVPVSPAGNFSCRARVTPDDNVYRTRHRRCRSGIRFVGLMPVLRIQPFVAFVAFTGFMFMGE